ncbi:SubName: Full=Uncharacterized protein {ECO:0000313/EMBL:CCA73652.1} [Serendipita indica DSM 11827]|nr:SubName: Full=Uncharacterized protein {ECO:0000313/EMBL:CCA73652.1} [Serendipita indica DSM 11827]
MPTLESKNSPSNEVDKANVGITQTTDERTTDNIVDTDVEKQQPNVTKEQKDKLPVPDLTWNNGSTAWLTVFGAWCILFCTFGLTNAYGIYQDFYVRHFLTNYTPSAIGWIGSVQLFFQFSLGLASGTLFDRG